MISQILAKLNISAWLDTLREDIFVNWPLYCRLRRNGLNDNHHYCGRNCSSWMFKLLMKKIAYCTWMFLLSENSFKCTNSEKCPHDMQPDRDIVTVHLQVVCVVLSSAAVKWRAVNQCVLKVSTCDWSDSSTVNRRHMIWCSRLGTRDVKRQYCTQSSLINRRSQIVFLIIQRSCAALHCPSAVSDLIVQAKSGTGKTCVFCTIALDSLVLENPATQVSRFTPVEI